MSKMCIIITKRCFFLLTSLPFLWLYSRMIFGNNKNVFFKQTWLFPLVDRKSIFLTLFAAKKQLETECTPCCHSNDHFITRIDNISIIFGNVKRHSDNLELIHFPQLESD